MNERPTELRPSHAGVLRLLRERDEKIAQLEASLTEAKEDSARLDKLETHDIWSAHDRGEEVMLIYKRGEEFDTAYGSTWREALDKLEKHDHE